MQKKIIFLGRFSPPFHGAAKINELYLNSKELNKLFKIKKIKINHSNTLDELGKLNLKKFFGVFYITFQLLYNLIKLKPDLIYFEIAPKGIAFYRDSLYVLICKLFSKKIIFQFQAKGVRESTNSNIKKTYYRFIFRKTKVILLSNLLYSDVQEIIPKENIYILPDVIEDEISEGEFQQIIIKRKQNKTSQLLFLSNLIESKGPIEVLKICNILKKQNIKFNCSFVGNFQDMKFKKKFLEKIKNLKLEKNCKYLGPKYEKEKQKIFEVTDYFIFPTKYPEECFPLVILEAFMYGIPVLSYNNGAIKEMISKNYTGFVSEKNKWSDLTTELVRRFKTTENPKLIRDYFKRNFISIISEKGMTKIWQKEIKRKIKL